MSTPGEGQREALERLRALLVRADSAVSCMFYRGAKSWGESETLSLIAELRVNALQDIKLLIHNAGASVTEPASEEAASFGPADAQRIREEGRCYDKVGCVWAIPVLAGTSAMTREGDVPQVLKMDGFIATDGKSCWPIAADFMAEHYRVRAGADVEGPSEPAGLDESGNEIKAERFMTVADEIVERVSMGRDNALDLLLERFDKIDRALAAPATQEAQPCGAVLGDDVFGDDAHWRCVRRAGHDGAHRYQDPSPASVYTEPEPTSPSAPAEPLAEQMTLASALAKAAEWFREYEEMHRNKIPKGGVMYGGENDTARNTAKAERNRERAEFCEAALCAALSVSTSAPKETSEPRLPKTFDTGDPVVDVLSWALDMLDMYDKRLVGIDGEAKVYTSIHLRGKQVAREVLAWLVAQRTPSATPAPAEPREETK